MVEILLLVGDVNTTLPTGIVSGERILENYVMKIESNKIDASQSDSSDQITLAASSGNSSQHRNANCIFFFTSTGSRKRSAFGKKLAENYILAPHGLSWLFQSCQFFNKITKWPKKKKEKEKLSTIYAIDVWY